MQKNLSGKDILGPMRLPFLLLPPVCVALGASVAYWRTGELNRAYVLLALLGAVLSHISVNAFNEYYDFKSGLDELTPKTPFSGGSGTLQKNPQAAKAAWVTAWTSFALTGLIGLYFWAVRGAMIVPLGVAGLLIVYAYTNWVTKNWLLSLILPGFGFGTLWVMGTDFVLTGSYSVNALVASFVPFFLVNNLLLLNQFPDAEADKTVGRAHLPIRIGNQASSKVYRAFLVLAYLTMILGVVLFKSLPSWVLLGLLTVPLAFGAAKGAAQYANDTRHLIPSLGKNVTINLLTPLLMAVGLWIAAAG
jgi:1,4-dihydroxy-2-naphthoate octaprenyltransferase